MSMKDFVAEVSSVKGQCTAAGDLLISQLDRRFPNHDIMEAPRVINPQYW